MATVRWISGAPEVSQVQDYLFGGTWESTDVITLTIGTVTVSTTAGSTAITTIIDSLVTLWNALDSDAYPQFAEATASRSGNNLRLTMDAAHAGKPLTCTLATTETGGGAADAQTIDGAASSTGTSSTANSGPNAWNVAANWSGGAVPVASDDVVIDGGTTESILYGLDQNTIALASLTILASYTGAIGLPKVNVDTDDSPYAEYRPDYLMIRPGTLRIGDGTGSGAQRIKIDKGTAAAATIVVVSTGVTRFEDGVPALLLKGANASDSYTIHGGDVGIAYYGGEAADLTGLCAIGTQGNPGTATFPLVYLGPGCTIVTATVGSGTVWIHAAVTTLVLNGGEVHHYRGAIGTITQANGNLIYDSTSAITTHTIQGGTAILNAAVTTLTLGDSEPTVRTRGQVTTLTVNSGRCWYDSASTITTGTVNGGWLETKGKVTTLTVNGGEHWHQALAVDVLVMTGGVLCYNSTGTLGGNPVVAGDAVLDFGKSNATKTVTNPIEVNGDMASVRDPNKTVTALVLDLNYVALDSKRFPIGTNIRLTRGTPA